MLCGNYIYNQYHDCHDVAYYLCADELNDVLVLPTENRTLTPVLACKDRMIRILQVSASFCSSVLLTIFNEGSLQWVAHWRYTKCVSLTIILLNYFYCGTETA